MRHRVVIGITGASGAIYGVRLVSLALEHFDEVYLCVSALGRQVLETEMGLDVAEMTRRLRDAGPPRGELILADPDDMFSPPASGSFRHSGMAIAPCSMGTAGRIASGVSEGLIARAGDVCLKERRPLVLIVRETPLSVVHLRNLTTLAEAGATVMPACPAFYHHPRTIEEVVDTVVHRALQHLGADLPGAREWQVEDQTVKGEG